MERLQAEQAHTAAQRDMYERYIADRETRHQQELENLRREFSSDAAPSQGKGKRRV